jgi:hypothetical protein
MVLPGNLTCQISRPSHGTGRPSYVTGCHGDRKPRINDRKSRIDKRSHGNRDRKPCPSDRTDTLGCSAACFANPIQ